MEVKILKTGVTKMKSFMEEMSNKVGKIAFGFVIVNVFVGLIALAGMILIESGSAKTFYSCAGLGIASLFNIGLSVITGLSFKDEETRVGKTVYAIGLVNLLVGFAPLAGTMILNEACTKPFYSYAGMFVSTSLISLLAIMVGMSFDIPE